MATQVFTEGAVQSAYVSYVQLDITENSLTLVWPSSYVNVPYKDSITGIYYQVLAASMDVITPLFNLNTITLPNAMQVSVGTNFIITNVGLAAFALNTSDGALLKTIAAGAPTPNSYYIQLIDNSNPVGVWRVITFGAGTSQADAVALAGNGLVALVDKLNTNVPVISTAVVPVIDATYRAKLIVWTGGEDTIHLPAIGTLPPAPGGFYFSFSNLGGGTVTIQPVGAGVTISGLTDLTVTQQQSLTIISDGTNWQTLGFGQNQFAVDTVNRLDVGGNANVILTSVQASAIIQEYHGLLTGNIKVFFPVETSNWFISNTTTGPHTLSVQFVGAVGTSYVVPQGSSQIFYSDGASMFPSTTAISLVNGTQQLPALSFSSNTGSGIHYETTGNGIIGLSINGVLAGSISTVGTSAKFFVTSANGTPLALVSDNGSASLQYNGVPFLNASLTGTTTFPVGPLTLSTGQFLAPDGTIGAPAYSFSSFNNTGFFFDTASPGIGIVVKGVLTAAAQTSLATGSLAIYSPTLVRIELLSDDTSNTGNIAYNGNIAIKISTTGVVTLPAAPLPIGSGGTNAINRATAIKNLMPAAAQGDIAYFDGTDWQVLNIGTAGQVLTVNGAGNGIEWA